MRRRQIGVKNGAIRLSGGDTPSGRGRVFGAGCLARSEVGAGPGWVLMARESEVGRRENEGRDGGRGGALRPGRSGGRRLWFRSREGVGAAVVLRPSPIPPPSPPPLFPPEECGSGREWQAPTSKRCLAGCWGLGLMPLKSEVFEVRFYPLDLFGTPHRSQERLRASCQKARSRPPAPRHRFHVESSRRRGANGTRLRQRRRRRRRRRCRKRRCQRRRRQERDGDPRR